jgi:hypothetical protein
MIRQFDLEPKRFASRSLLVHNDGVHSRMIIPAPATVDAGSPADSPPSGAPGLVAWYAEGFSDSLGDRLCLFDNAGPALELLRFSPHVATLPGFESAVRARIDALASFSHPAFAKVRTLTVLDDPQPQLALVSKLATGERLSAVLRAAHARGARLDPTCAIWLLRQVLPALAAFHDVTGGAPHRLLDADRVVVAATGEVAITEYVFGGLPEELLTTPRTTDVGQAALLAVAILRGRPLGRDEFNGPFDRLIQHACATSPSADVLRPWLVRALTLGPDRFKSAREAYHALDELLPGVWGSWRSSRDLAAVPAVMPPPPAPINPRRSLWQRALPPAPSPSNPVARQLWRVNRALVAVASVEAACIVALIVSVVMSGAFTDPSGAPQVHGPGVAPVLPRALPTGPPSSVTLAPEAAALLVAPPELPEPAVPMSAPDSVIGSLVIDSDVAVKVYINGRLLGVATHRSFGVPEGEHTITLANEGLNFQSTQAIKILPGRSVMITATPQRP